MTSSERAAVWNPFGVMAAGNQLSTRVQVQSPTAPAGGMLTFVATGFGSAGPLRVFIDHEWDHPIGVFHLEDDETAHDRVPIPSSTGAGPHLLTFVAGLSDFDLLIDVTSTPATVSVEPSVAHPGDVVTFKVLGFPPGELAHVKLDDAGAALPFAVDANGTGVGRYVLPDRLTAGPHHLRFLAPNPATSTIECVQVSERPPGSSSRP